MRWMIDNQLGRRNLSPAQRVVVIEKYRPIFEDKARENIHSGLNQHSSPMANLPNPKIDTRKELAQLANIGERSYDKVVLL